MIATILSLTNMGHKKVLILGSGFVSAPVVDYLSRDSKTCIIIASVMQDEADKLAERFPNTTSRLLDVVKDSEVLEFLVDNNDLVVSLLPYALHPRVARVCIERKTNMVTASYITPEMNALDQSAVEAGVTILNEVGVDPGIDHMLAMNCFDQVRNKGGEITSFVSWCGGLPAPEHSENPLRYRFSWCPLGVFMSALSGARYLQDGNIVEVPGDGEVLNCVQPIDFLPGFNLEGIPNKDATCYAGYYNLKSVDTILRGTLRYKGFCERTFGLVQLGLLDTNPHSSLHKNAPDISWRQYICELVGQPTDTRLENVKEVVFQKVGFNEDRLDCIERLGLLSNVFIDKMNTPIDTLSEYLAKTLSYGPNQRDLIIMRHNIGIEWEDHSRETRHIDFIVYGELDGYSAMAKTVGFPTGIAAKMILDGEVKQCGMLRPLTPDIYSTILMKLKQEGLTARESSSVL